MKSNISEVVDSINGSPHSGIYGLLPKDIDSSTEGEFTLELLRRKFAPNDHFLSTVEQQKLEEEFHSNPKNKLLKVGRYCLADVRFSSNLSKGFTPKRSVICKIKAIDFRQKPVLFTLETAFDKKILPIKVRPFCFLFDFINTYSF